TLYLSMFIHYFSILHIYTFSLHDALPVSFFFKIFSVITCSNCVISLAISTASVRFPSCWLGKVSLIVVIASPLWLKYVCLTFLVSFPVRKVWCRVLCLFSWKEHMSSASLPHNS